MNTLRAHGLVALALWVGAVATGCLFDSAGLDQDAGRQDTGVDGHAGGGQGGDAAAGGNAAGSGQGGNAAAGGNAAGSGQGGNAAAGGNAAGGGQGGGEGGQGGGAETGGSGGEGGGSGEGKVFETVWKIPKPNPTLVLPYYDDGSGTAKCDFTILWGDEGAGSDFSKGTHVTDCSTKSNITHTYAATGTYHVKIKGVYNGWGAEPNSGISIGNCSSYCGEHVLRRLVEVVRFGPVGLTRGAFACTDSVKLPEKEVPDASLWRNGHGVFACGKGIGEAITRWDTSNVTNMSGMFYQAAAFNQPLSSWNTSQVTNMSGMFVGATAFDQNLAPWNVAKVTEMDSIFFLSGITKPNYCAVKSLPVWKDHDLGKWFVRPCP